MSKTITLRLDDQLCNRFRKLADRDNRPLSNFIQTAAFRFIESEQFVDEFEMDEIHGNKNLSASIKNGFRDAKAKRGQFA